MNIYERAVRDIRDRRREKVDALQIVFQNALREDDALYNAYRAYTEQCILGAEGKKSNVEKAKKQLNARLTNIGLSLEALNPDPDCPLCGDTGMVDGRYCACALRAAINSDRQNHTLPPVDLTEAQKTAPDCIKPAYADLRAYANGDGQKPFVVILGSSGTGKTTLASAVATELMKKGLSAVTVTAFDFVRRALDYHTRFTIDGYIDRFTPMLDCDLLVIDDLGRESVFKNVTNEYLYAVVNQRWVDKQRTIVTSNLTPKSFASRYDAAVASRLLDKNLSIRLNINAPEKNARI